MRILIANWRLQLIGGVETYLRDLIPALRQRGHDVRLLTENRPAPGDKTLDGGVPAWFLEAPDKDQSWLEIGEWSPDVCFLHGLSLPADHERLLELMPTVFFAHNYHGTCVTGSKRHAFPSLQPCDRVFGAGCLVQFYPRRCGGLNPVTMLRLYGLQASRNQLLPRYPAIVVASRHMAREYARHGVPPEKIHLAPLFPTGEAATPEAIRPMTGRLVLMGRLTEIKGGDHAVRATRIASDRLGRRLTLVVLGDGPGRGRLERLARDVGQEAEFLGWTPAHRRDDELRRSDLMLVPSTWPEPFGLAGIEAGRLGVPSVGFAVGGVPDWLIPGVSGELASPPCGRASLADAIVRALASPVRWSSLCQGAVDTARRFSLESHVGLVEDLLFRVAARSATPTPGGAG